MAKQVKIKSGSIFPTLKQAKEYFSEIRERTEPGVQLTDQEREDVIDVYMRYCKKTNWPPVDAVGVTTEWDNRERQEGSYAQTKAFSIITSEGHTTVFSIDKALSSIAA